MRKISEVQTVKVEVAKEVLESIFQECDHYDRDETGGRILGHFVTEGETLIVQASRLIEAGPKARRTSTSFFQDGDYQTEVFRQIEAEDASIEHLGNWHTHHVNGYPTLSQGDVATYRRIVNHEMHNLDFFYALLVTHRNDKRDGLDRYAVRHYVLFRGDEAVHEVQPANVRLTDERNVPKEEGDASDRTHGRESLEEDDSEETAADVRIRDKTVLRVLCPSMQPRLSSRTRTFFWKGSVLLADGSTVEVKVAEVDDDGELQYFPIVASAPEDLTELCETPFKTASHAIRALELRMNSKIFKSILKGR